MRPERLYEYLAEVDNDTKNVDCSEISLEAEIYLGMVRNKISQIIPHMDSVRKVFDVLPELIRNYELFVNEVSQEDPNETRYE